MGQFHVAMVHTRFSVDRVYSVSSRVQGNVGHNPNVEPSYLLDCISGLVGIRIVLTPAVG